MSKLTVHLVTTDTFLLKLSEKIAATLDFILSYDEDIQSLPARPTRGKTLFLYDCSGIDIKGEITQIKRHLSPSRTILLFKKISVKKFKKLDSLLPAYTVAEIPADASQLFTLLKLLKTVTKTNDALTKMRKQNRDLRKKLKERDKKLNTVNQQNLLLNRQRFSLGQILDKMEKVTHLSETINCLDMNEIANICVNQVPALIEARYASFYLYDYHTNCLNLAKHNHKRKINKKIFFDRKSNTPMFIALKTKQLTIIKDLAQFEKQHNIKITRSFKSKYGSKTCIIVPLVTGNHIVGCLNYADKIAGDDFDIEQDIPYIQQLSVIISAAIRNCQLYEQVREQATTDSMTGFINHKTFFDELEREIVKFTRYRSPLSLILLDIDNFKEFNDTHGHQTGDFILQEVANLIQKSIRSIDIPARYGGDEFAIIVTQTELDDAFIVAERIRKSVARKSFVYSGSRFKLTLSIGVTNYTAGMTSTRLVKKADEAMYRAKEKNKNRVEVLRSPV